VPDTQTPVDEAYARYEILSNILERTRQQALANPMHRRNIELGLTKQFRTRNEVEKDIQDAFEDLTNLINHLAIIDMAAAFEGYLRPRLGTAIGEARRLLRENYELEPFLQSREKLVHETDDFQGLARIRELIGGHLSAETSATLSQIREDRNNFAHGTNIRVPPTTTTKRTRETLNSIIEVV